MWILNSRHAAALRPAFPLSYFWCRPLRLSHFSLLFLQKGSKFATCLLTRHWPDRPPEKERHHVRMMNAKVISEIQRAGRHCQPSPAGCMVRYQPACLHISFHCCLSHPLLFLSLSTRAWLMLFLSSRHSVYIYRCFEHAGKLRTISLKPLHSPLPNEIPYGRSCKRVT